MSICEICNKPIRKQLDIHLLQCGLNKLNIYDKMIHDFDQKIKKSNQIISHEIQKINQFSKAKHERLKDRSSLEGFLKKLTLNLDRKSAQNSVEKIKSTTLENHESKRKDLFTTHKRARMEEFKESKINIALNKKDFLGRPKEAPGFLNIENDIDEDGWTLNEVKNIKSYKKIESIMKERGLKRDVVCELADKAFETLLGAKIIKNV
jgi:hypothetical protein